MADNRRTDTKKLHQLVRGELDWIVMKALEKDRNRRYETATELQKDIERYLADEPVEACPPSALYRFRKFARRNRGPVLAATLILMALMCGIAVSTWQAVRAYTAEQQARAAVDAERKAKEAETSQRKEAEEVSKFLVETLRSPDPEKDGRTITIAELLDRAAKEVQEKFADDPFSKAALLQAIGESYKGLGLYREATPLLEQVCDYLVNTPGQDIRFTINSMGDLSNAYREIGRNDDALRIDNEMVKLANDKLGPSDRETLRARNILAHSIMDMARTDEAIRLQEETYNLMKSNLGKEDPDTLVAMGDLASFYSHAGRIDEAISLHEKVLKLEQSKGGIDTPRVLILMNNLALDYINSRKRVNDGIALLEKTVNMEKIKLGPDNLSTLCAMNNLAFGYHKAGRNDEAIRLQEDAVKLATARLGPAARCTRELTVHLTTFYVNVSRYDDAKRLLEEAIRLHPDFSELHEQLSVVFRLQGKYPEAEAEAREAVRLEPTGFWAKEAHGALANILGREGRRTKKIPKPRRLRQQTSALVHTITTVTPALPRLSLLRVST